MTELGVADAIDHHITKIQHLLAEMDSIPQFESFNITDQRVFNGVMNRLKINNQSIFDYREVKLADAMQTPAIERLSSTTNPGIIIKETRWEGGHKRDLLVCAPDYLDTLKAEAQPLPARD